MRHIIYLLLAVSFFAAGCVTPSPDDPDHWYDPSLRGPQGTVGYHVKVLSTQPGIRIEVNGEYRGQIEGTEGTIVLYGDRDGTFHGDGYTTIRAMPVTPGQHTQIKQFSNNIGGGDRIPRQIFFDPNLVPLGDKKTLDVNVK